jgi:hypothetical protein
MKFISELSKLLLSVLSVFIFSCIFALEISAQKSVPPATEIGDDGVPVLIKHLPDWETAQNRAAIVASLQELQKLSGNRQILNEIDFAGGTEAVTATYDKARLVIIEFQTPQMAFDADARVQNKLTQATPSDAAYRKIGNYLVFVFDASDAKTADNLLNSVSYEKQVVWFGDNPYPAIASAKKEREYLMTTGDIIFTVIESAGLAILFALGIGGVFGTLLFYRRRRQQAATDTFSDAGGMLRLNLDELTPQTDTSRLLDK